MDEEIIGPICQQGIHVRYNAILDKIIVAQKNWQIIKADLGICQESKKFLKGSYLVVSHASAQINPSDYMSNIRDTVLSNTAILKTNEIDQHYIKICKEYWLLEKKLKSIKSKDEQKKTAGNLKIIQAEFENFDLSQLDFSDDFCVESRFQGIRTDIIQKIKLHPLVDAFQTCTCAACIRVVVQSNA